MNLSSVSNKLGAVAAVGTVAALASALRPAPAHNDALAIAPAPAAKSQTSAPSQKQLAANMGRASAGALGYGMALEHSMAAAPAGGELSLSDASGLEETALYDVARFANSLLRGSAVVQAGQSGPSVLSLTETAVSLCGQPLFESYTSARDVESPATTLMARCTQIAAVAAQVLDAAGETDRANALFEELMRLPIAVGSVVGELTQVRALCRTARVRVTGNDTATAAVASLATELLSATVASPASDVDVLLLTAGDAPLLEVLKRVRHSTVIVTDSDAVAELAAQIGVLTVKVPSAGDLTPLLMLAAVAQFRP